MEKVITTNQEACVGCNRCVRQCPIETANYVSQDEQGNIKVSVDNTKCIACGLCLSVCKHDARRYLDDTHAFFRDLALGVPISVITAPAVKTNFPDWKRLLAYLRQKGARKIYDVSLGADICIWGHLRYVERYGGKPLITQPCPCIVSYCEKHRPELLEHLSPVQSPMGSLAVYMRKYEGITDNIAAISPCIAKKNEFGALGTIRYNITFAGLENFFRDNSIVLPRKESGFDHHESGLGRLFPTPGGLKENIEFFAGGALWVDKAEGRHVYGKLDTYAVTPKEFLPRIFDVLNCREGCNMGPAAAHNRNYFQIAANMESARQAAGKRKLAHYNKVFSQYDQRFDLSDFLRSYALHEGDRIAVSEEDIQSAFALLEKDTYAKQNFNCGACGSESCRGMAKKIALKVNLPINCIVKSRDDMFLEQKKNRSLYKRSAQYVEAIHEIGRSLLSVADDGYTDALVKAAKSVSELVHIASAAVWKLVEDNDGQPFAERIFNWSEGDDDRPGRMYLSWAPELFAALAEGETIVRHASGAGARERSLLLGQEYASILMLPVSLKKQFWGFLTVSSDRERVFSDEEVSVVVSTGLVVVSSLIEKELTDHLIAAREEALSGMRAKSEFLSRMSHEMRTPMNAIIGMSKIADNTEDISKLKYCLTTVRTSALHLLGLINNILDMSKIESGKFELNNALFSLEHMLMKLSGIMSDAVEKKKQKLHMAIGDGVREQYIGDELRLSQVLANLLSNAVKFTPEEGGISLHVQAMEEKDDRTLLRFSVADTGIGMAPEQLPRLFVPFEQADGSITKRFGGTGLGLAISKSIVEKMKGTIWAESQVGVGSTFFLDVELERDSSPATADMPHCAGAAVLYVDSDAEMRCYFAHVARRLGLNARMADSMGSAVAHLKEARAAGAPCTAIFVAFDAQNPAGIDCAAAGADIAGAESIVIVTSFAEWQRTEAAFRAIGISAFISRPLFPSAIAARVNALAGVAASGSLPAPGKAAALDFSDVSLLLAEDIELNREIFITLLEETKMHIDTAENGRIAVRKFEADPEKYDIIVMDLQMPEMDGLEATRAIRSSKAERGRTIPIIAMTANAFKEDIDKCLASGMNAHLAKPIDLDAVQAAIMRYSLRQ